MRKLTVDLIFFATIFLAAPSALGAGRATLIREGEIGPPAEDGLVRLEQALQTKGIVVDRSDGSQAVYGDVVVLAGLGAGAVAAALNAEDVTLPQGPEALAIRRTTHQGKPAVLLWGSDTRGLMYAALDAADRILWAQSASNPFAQIRDVVEEPDVIERSVSIYTMQRAYFESRLYDERYWRRYFDMLSACRFNSFVVIFGYENGGFMAPPYPYFFDLDGFPGVRLTGITPAQQQRNVAAFKAMVRIAHEHGIDVIAAIWDHIYRGGVQGGGIPGASENAGKEAPHLVSGVTAENLVPYTKAALLRFLEVFPELDGLQFRMHGESGLKREEMEGFWHDVFGIIHEKNPGIRVDLRAKELPDSIINDALSQGLKVRVTTKYWMEQMGMPFHPTHINRQNQRDRRHGYADLLRYPQKYTVHWRLWNGGTTRLLLWGDPDYVKRFASTTHLYGGRSFEINEMLATKMLGSPHDEPPAPILNEPYRYYDYEFERYWHFYQVWGRVSYNPDTPPETWEREFQRRFGAVAGAQVMNALHLASNVLPRIVASSYLYQHFPTTRGWAEMMRGDDLPKYAGMEGSDIAQFMNLRDAARSLIEGTETAMRRPEETSRWFENVSERITAHVREAETAVGGRAGKELVSTLVDLKILAGLAKYHAARLRAGLSYNLYKETGDLFSFDDAVAQEKQAVAAWERIVEAAGGVYSENLAFGVHQVGFSRHWKEELQALRRGLDQLLAERQQSRLQAASLKARIAHVPVRQSGPGSAIRIRATVALPEPKQVNVLVAGSKGGFRAVPMQRVEAGMYQAEVRPGSADDRLRYFIEVREASGGPSTWPQKGKNDPVVVAVTADRQPPSVWPDPPAKANPGENLTVTARVQDPSGVGSARLRYRHLTQFEDYHLREMTLDPKTGLYTAQIPGSFITPEWDLIYFIEALDIHGNGRMYPDLETDTPYIIVSVAR